MSSVHNKTNRPWQFRLVWLFVGILLVALGCTLWLNESQGWAILLNWAISLILPALWLTGAIYFRGYARAFFIGMTVPQAFYSLKTVTMIAFLPLEWDLFASFIQEDEPYVDYVDISVILGTPPLFARSAILVFGLGLLAGLLAIGMRWLAIKLNSTQA